MPARVVAAIIVVVLYLIGFSWSAAIGIVLLLAALIMLVAWLADKGVIRLWHVGVLVLVCFVGNRSCAYIVSERQLHQSLSVMPGIQVKPIFGPANFPSISDLDDSQFDIASDGSIVFRSGDQLLACTMSNDGNSIAVVAEEEGLNAFIFDAGGALLTMNQGVLGQFNPDQSAVTTWRDSAPQIDLTQGPHLAMVQFAPYRGRPGGAGQIRGGGSGYGGGGGGSFFSDGPRITIGDTFRWFFTPSRDLVTEKVDGGPPPPLSDGAYNYTLVVREPRRLPKHPQPLQLLQGPGMRLARGGAAGEVLVFGSHNTSMARELHRIYSDGTAQWVANTASPIVFAAEGHGHLYIVIAPVSHNDEEQLQDWKIVHLPLGTNELNSPALVFNSLGVLTGDRRILSFALSESGKTLFFSVPNRVYAIRGPLVVKLLDGISGILRTHGDTLYVFNAKRKALLAVTGFE